MRTKAARIGTRSLGRASRATSRSVSQKTPVWTVCPGLPTYYINSVAISADGSKVAGGTFYHTYTATPPAKDNTSSPASDPQTGTFGTYCYDGAGNLLWKDEFNGWQGVTGSIFQKTDHMPHRAAGIPRTLMPAL